MNRVSVLIKTNFTGLSLEDKINIKKLGRPLKMSWRFSRDIYKQNNWIVGVKFRICSTVSRMYYFSTLQQ